MTLEPVVSGARAGEGPELRNMLRRLWVALVLTAALRR